VGDMQKTAIIIPCYNEEARLDLSGFSESSAKNQNLHYIFVNDGSTDNTERKLDALCRLNPLRMQYITLGKNVGKAEAVRKGFVSAFEGDFENVGYWDADLATPLEMIPKFCEILESTGKHMVIGSRVRLLGRNVQRRAIRHYLGRLFATCASIILGLPVYDTQCGAKLFRNTKELRMVFQKPFRVKWTFDVEILARFILFERFMDSAPLTDFAVEYPLEVWIDIPGSKIKMGDFLLGGFELLKIFYFLRWPGAGNRYMEYQDF
jgi:glycosyltransferase involved in cell wall biosynthesis